VLVLIFAGCGGADDELVAPSDDDRPSTTIDDTTIDDTADDSARESAVSTSLPADERADPSAAEVTGSLPLDRLSATGSPADADAVMALLSAIPDELIGGTKMISAQPGDLAADYVSPERMSQYGVAAMDLRTSMMGGFVSEPVAEQLVAVFAEGADWDVEDVGVVGTMHWVTWITTGSGEGIEGIETIYILTWGEQGSPWAFTIGAPTELGRAELAAAFVEAAAAADADDQPATPDEEAAQAALLTAQDLGDEWLSQPRIPNDGEAFDELMTGLMADEPLCATSLEWIERQDAALSGLFDLIAADSIARAESPTYVSQQDGGDLSHTVLVYAAADQASGALRATQELGVLDCVVAIYDELAGAGFPGATVSVDSAKTRPLDLGDDSTALRFELTLTAPGGDDTLVVSQDVSVVASGRAVSTIVRQSFGSPIDEQRLESVINLAAERLAEQFGQPE
jgi:hypothetical protein